MGYSNDTILALVGSWMFRAGIELQPIAEVGNRPPWIDKYILVLMQRYKVGEARKANNCEGCAMQATDISNRNAEEVSKAMRSVIKATSPCQESGWRSRR